MVLSEGAWSTALARVSEGDTITGPQPQGRDPEDVRQYPGERLMGRFAGPVRADEFEE